MLILNLITSNVSGVNMCSTPRPRTKVKGKAGSSGSILSTMSSEARSSFTERANAAQERRHQISIKTQQKKQQSNASIKNAKKVARSAKKQKNSFSSWLLNASLKDVFMMLFFNNSKHT
ncbi:hypothetical protein FGD67_11170 [Colwellia sp. M166]|uniref:hypothetical protein n=1 Tax=Colwellia sp. M166 TaxID=2583805 RepID=UPI00211F1D68|nr:hypothetical protein [Colwellia sp. M166]UUO23736.1 hypothetical protein FGD67_11170 [Colwellia sp. M166]|tara:strand:- start:2950 stop:3306 length:357 start_codon:yes stop_codon:yes gene_type:complete